MKANKKKVIFIVFGTRPEAIKMVPVVKELKKLDNVFDTKVCITAQHREMLDQVIDAFQVKADYDLDVMKPGQDLSYISSEILNKLRQLFKQIIPDIILVHGDTITSTIVSLSAFFHKIPVGHVEAGLRTNNVFSPWPEEMNRQLTGRLATYHFAPTQIAKENLIKENISQDNIFVTGNTVVDTLIDSVQKINSDHAFQLEIKDHIKKKGYDVNRLEMGRKLILITGHRRENFGDGFKNICLAIKELSEGYPDVDFLYPVHLNPNVQKPVKDILTDKVRQNVFLLPPLAYFPFVYLMSKSFLILTDSGGIQEEAPGLNIPVLVMRDATERPEAIEAGTAKLVGTNKKSIVQQVVILLTDKRIYQNMASADNPYGDGMASKRIAKHLAEILK